MNTFRCEFLGCKVNQYDAERARRSLLDHGFRETEEDADVLLLAGCTVTAVAARKSKKLVRSFLRRRPEGRVGVLGCVSAGDRRWYETLTPRVTFLPSARDDQFLSALEPILSRGRSVPSCPAPVSDGAKSTGRSMPERAPPARRTRVFLKVEDGCDLRCAYCIIPQVRGRARSRGASEIVEEFGSLVRQGTREIVLTGVHLGHYGRRSPDSLPGLLRSLLDTPGDWRLRISSLEVSEIDPELREILTHARIVPHLHLPLQSGSARVLRRMRRPYTLDRFRQTVSQVREELDEPALTTDVIVGFPGEEEGDHRDTLQLCREIGFDKIHVFPFSAREGTEAAELPGALEAVVIERRKRELLALAEELRAEAADARIGRAAELVVDRRRGDHVEGVDERYFRVTTHAPDGAVGDLLRVWIEDREGDRLIGRRIALEAAH